MYPTKIHRLSGPSVVIGYLLLLPSLLGILAAIGFIVLVIFAARNAPSIAADDAAKQLTEAGIENGLVEKITNLKISVEAPAIKRLTNDQKVVVTEAQSAILLGGAGTAFGSLAIIGIAIAFAIACFVSGLIGYLLTMKKKVLQCSACRAVVGAS